MPLSVTTRLAPHRPSTEAFQRAAHVGARHRDDFHGQRERAQGVDQLALVGDTDEPARRRGDDLLARQSRAPTLDQLALMVGFIGAVDIGLDLADLVQVQDRDAGGLQPLASIHWSSIPRPRCFTLARELIDEEVDRGTGADTQHLAGDDEFQRCARRSLFSSVLRTHRVTPEIYDALKRHCPLGAGTVFEFEAASEKVLSLAVLTKAEELLLLGFLLGLFLGFRHGASPVVTG